MKEETDVRESVSFFGVSFFSFFKSVKDESWSGNAHVFQLLI